MPEQPESKQAIRLARQALALAREVMRDGPPGIDPMAASRAEDWRDIRDQLDRLERGGSLKQLFARTGAAPVHREEGKG